MKCFSKWAIVLCTFWAATSAIPARADLMLSIQPVTVAPGSVNDTFELYLTNMGGSTVDVAAFDLEITTPSSNIVFEQSTTMTTTLPYIFLGNSLFGPTISTSFGGQILDESDAASAGFTVVAPGMSYGLGEVTFDVTSGAKAGFDGVVYNPLSMATSFSDQNDNSLALSFSSGAIDVSSPSTTPEPAPWLLLVTGLAMAMVWRVKRSALAR